MKPTVLISLFIFAHLAAFVSYPETGRMGVTFIYVSLLLWSAFSFLICLYIPKTRPAGKAAWYLLISLACAFFTLNYLPQKNRVSPLYKLAGGKYPDRRSVFLGLLRVGIYYPALLPPPGKEVLP